MTYDEWLMHFNPNHDPKDGKFAKSSNPISNLKASIKKKKAARQKRNDYYNDAVSYDREFEDSKEGRRLRSAHDRAYEKYFDSEDDNPELEKKFTKAEYDYLSAAGKYTAAKLIKKYGAEYVSEISGISKYSGIDDLIKKYGDRYVTVHGV